MTGLGGEPGVDFDLCGPLPSGTTVLEASAGTGKTFTIAALAARYVAEGVELGSLLLVTFGRMASHELRQRVRERLVVVEEQLLDVLAGRHPATAPDPVAALLIAGTIEELELRRARISRALADFDAATIATTHEFCLQMLDGLGVLGDAEPQAVFVEQLTELTAEVATDLYLARYAPTGQPPLLHDQALQVAQEAVANPHARLVPDDGQQSPTGPAGPSESGERVRYAAAVRREVARRQRLGRLFSYDDMLTRLRDALADPIRGAAAARRLQQRFRVVMVDEFQDTDPVQWEILRRAFHTATTLILIGDPKQAIYAFRGADVYSYLQAREVADRVQTLSTNRRSDAALLAALGTLMGGAALGEEAIVVRSVHASHREQRLRSATRPDAATPLRLRVLPHEPDAEQVPSVGTIRPRILLDVVREVKAALTSDLELDPSAGSAGTLPGGTRRLQPADLAILVRKNERGEAVRDALVGAGIPAVMLGAGSVYASPTATEWLTLLLALEQPRQSAIRQAALTCFVGWSFERLAGADEPAVVELTQLVRRWARVLAGRGVAALLEAVTTDTGLTERILGDIGGERRLTDLRHLGQSLHAAMTAGQLGVSALVEWLREQITEARTGTGGEGTRRLETDAAAVTILTVHRSKGLEFPVVFLPEAWDRHLNRNDEGRTLRLHEEVDGRVGDCVLDVGGRPGPGRPERFARFQAEEAGEDLRLLYVALTRARCQVVAWWAPTVNTPASALQRFLGRPAPPAGTSAPVAPTYPLRGDPRTGRDLGPHIAVELVPTPPVGTGRRPADGVASPPAAAADTLPARRFDRELDLSWRRTSYSALTAGVHGLPVPVGVGSEPENVKEDDEVAAAESVTGFEPADAAPAAGGPGHAALELPSPMAELPTGTAFGTTVHAVFEEVDPAGPDLPEALRSATSTAAALSGGRIGAEQLATALLSVYATPLGPLVEDRALRDIAAADRLPELPFEFPLAGGDLRGVEPVLLRVVASLLRRHLSPTDPLAGYADRLDVPGLADQALRGFLTGSIDAVLRVPDEQGRPRYLVVDYKTNWLGDFEGTPLTVASYTPPRLAEAMMAAHYPLQALLYAVAVHRMLRWRQPGYDPGVHLGGVLYLFVRGMAGPDTPRLDGVPCGVFSWRPPGALVTGLSDALAGTLPAPGTPR